MREHRSKLTFGQWTLDNDPIVNPIKYYVMAFDVSLLSARIKCCRSTFFPERKFTIHNLRWHRTECRWLWDDVTLAPWCPLTEPFARTVQLNTHFSISLSLDKPNKLWARKRVGPFLFWLTFCTMPLSHGAYDDDERTKMEKCHE